VHRESGRDRELRVTPIWRWESVLKHTENTMNRRNFLRAIAAVAIAAGFGLHCGAEDNPRPPGPKFTFGVVADVQYGDCDPVGSRYYRASLKKLAECVREFNARKVDFAIQLGDLIEQDFAAFEPVLEIWNCLDMPKYHVLGNHDLSGVEDQQKNAVVAKLGMKSRYYSFKVKGWRFIVLDGNDVSVLGVFPREGNPRYEEGLAMQKRAAEMNKANAPDWNGGIGSLHRAWLQAELRKAASEGEKVVVFCHFPVFPPNVHNLWNDDEVLEVIESNRCVAAYVNGHNHAGNDGEKNGVHFLTLKGMCETEENAYAIIEVCADHLKIVGYGRERSRVLKLR
jgi:manganese-dependent ADP-ribose/CDP-alcohol diphosphatase